MKIVQKSKFLLVRQTLCGLTAALVLGLGSSANADTVLFEDSFSYPDGTLAGNGGWYRPPVIVGDLVVSNGQVVAPGGTGHQDAAAHAFSRAGFEDITFTVSVEGETTDHNQIGFYIATPGVTAAYAAWYYSGGWIFNGVQSGIGGAVDISAVVDPVANTVIGQLHNSATGALLYTSIVYSVTDSEIEDSTIIYLYADSRIIASNMTWDNLQITAAANPNATRIRLMSTPESGHDLRGYAA